ncbi:MAG: hypothetical protein HXX13_11425 [Bacteroidetes bacterium]|nr:hypothetical protein [Bacteroidota bacterium]
MIRFLTNDQINLESWDSCIFRSINGNIYGYSWYLNMVCPGWCALVEDDYIRIMPLPAWKKFGINYLVQPLFTQQLGIYSSEQISSRDVRDFLYKIPSKFKYVDMNLNSANKIEITGLSHGYNINYELLLNLPYKEISALYSDNLKRNLKRANKYVQSISRNVEPLEIITLFRKNRGDGIKALSDSQYDVLRKVFSELLQRGHCEIWGVYHPEKQKLMGAVAWVYSNNRIIFLFSAVSDSGKQKGAMPFLIDSLIREKAGSELILDFEGSNDPNLGRFYAGFGSSKVFYPRIRMNKLSILLHFGTNIYRNLRIYFRK